MGDVSADLDSGRNMRDDHPGRGSNGRLGRFDHKRFGAGLVGPEKGLILRICVPFCVLDSAV
jgi:hypothetical protein